MILYLKALHIIFVVTWFAGLFYAPRLIIYFIEASNKPIVVKQVIQQQMKIMLKRLWFGITWPSAFITFILGIWVALSGNWFNIVFQKEGKWFLVKLILVLLLYGYHFSLQYLYTLLKNNKLNYSAQQIRYWNEVPTVLLFSIVFTVVIKEWLSFFWGLSGLLLLMLILIGGIMLYKKFRNK
ncbi:CopD family protein [Sediminibacterium sp.]|uniref:CopD family protein n=1 Tax=Sediminibacterium sp. TaxID=1917865 RepID=UPI0025D0453E|nr:CopD family protein [Sediminibacterium sp.]MBT9484422.1 CopD family protein [Sediminibacterium sp.]MDP2420630.1 CopD family protein [Sediminibacterium sp.]